MSATSETVRRTTVVDIGKLYADGTRIAMLTAYDYPTAQILDEAGIPMLLVGDSLGQVILGYETTVRVTMAEMVHHTKAVVRGTQRALIVGDMPFLSYATPAEAVENAGIFLREAGAFSMVLELVPEQLAAAITERLRIPTIGIGAGAGCSGQVQIITDLIGLGDFIPRHARPYVQARGLIR